MPQENEVNKFFEELPGEDKKIADIFGTEKKSTDEVVPNEPKSDEDEPRKTRRYRRLEEKLKRSEEMQLALNDRIKELSEERQFRQDIGNDEIDPRFEKLFSADEAGKMGAKTLQSIIDEKVRQAKEEAKLETVQEFENRQQDFQKQTKSYEELIDSELEKLEDEYDVDLTSDSPKAEKARAEFLDLVGRLSPKDENGDPISYADFGETFELYQSKQTRLDNSRRNDIASRSMAKGGSSTVSTPKQPTAGFFGWKKDLKL